MNIYLAAPWAHKETAREVAAVLEAEGFTLASRWLREHKDSTDHRELQREAVNDLEDLDNSDVLVLLNLGKSDGKATEFGYAYRSQLPIIVVGSATGNVFYHLPTIYRVDTIEHAVRILHKGINRLMR